jgi:serine/threonine protein kinase
MPEAPETFRAGRYAVVRVLGEGAQGTTFEAVDKQAGMLVAVKRFRVRGAKSWKEVELAEREARVLASIAHPALPRYIEHFEEGGELFLVTEKIEGDSLAALKKRGAPFSERDVVRLLRDASAALDYLHGRAPPIIHRDLKPSNVLRRPDGSFAFIDFGAVRDKLKPEGGSTVVGTFGYMAPEQFQGRAMPTSDVYGIGATALSLLTGREPEELPHRGLGIDVEAALRGVRVSPALVRLLGTMLEPDPDKRAQSLGPGLATLGEPAPRPRDRPEPRRPAREDRRDERRERHLARREPRHGSGGLVPGLVFAVVMLSLTIAEIAVMLALRVAVPLLLTMLSLVFGKGLRRAAERVAASGKTAATSIRRIRDGLRVPEREIGARVVDGAPGLRVDPGDAEAEQEAAEDEAAAAERREQARRR